MEGKPEAYYFPPQVNFSENNFPYTFFGLEPDDFSIYLPDSWEGRSAQELATIIKTQLQITPTETTNSDNKPLLVFL